MSGINARKREEELKKRVEWLEMLIEVNYDNIRMNYKNGDGGYDLFTESSKLKEIGKHSHK